MTMSRDAYERLTNTMCSPEELVRKSLEFLLEHEPKESNLSQFDVTVISRYFPHYEEEIARRIRL